MGFHVITRILGYHKLTCFSALAQGTGGVQQKRFPATSLKQTEPDGAGEGALQQQLVKHLLSDGAQGAVRVRQETMPAQSVR